jgi:hypothetical protein
MCIALAYKGLAFEPHYVSLPKMEHHTADYTELNPQRLVPLVIDGGRRYIRERHEIAGVPRHAAKYAAGRLLVWLLVGRQSDPHHRG